MSTQSLTMTLPAGLAQELSGLDRELFAEILRRGLRQWRIENALEAYSAGEMSFGAAAEQAGIGQSDLARHAYACGMRPAWSEETLAEELA